MQYRRLEQTEVNFTKVEKRENGYIIPKKCWLLNFFEKTCFGMDAKNKKKNMESYVY